MTVRTMFDSPEFAGAVMAKDEAKVAGQAEKCSLKNLDQVRSLGVKSSFILASKYLKILISRIHCSCHVFSNAATLLS